MTDYYLSLGYQADAPYVPYPENGEEYKNFLWTKLKEVFCEVCTNTPKLRADILNIGFQKLLCHGDTKKENEKTLDECLKYLREAFSNGHDSYPGINNEDQQIEFETNCRTKYQVYRAVIRNVILEMHKIGIEINVDVR